MTRLKVKLFEKYVVERFLEAEKSTAKFCCFGDAGTEADVIIKDGQLKQGIEVVTAYRDNEQAQMYWDAIDGNDMESLKNYVNYLKQLSFDAKDLLLENLNKQIANKCQKSLLGRYGEKSKLLIFENSPFTNDQYIDSVIKKIIIAENNFSEIYLLNETEFLGNCKVYKINKRRNNVNR